MYLFRSFNLCIKLFNNMNIIKYNNVNKINFKIINLKCKIWREKFDHKGSFRPFLWWFNVHNTIYIILDLQYYKYLILYNTTILQILFNIYNIYCAQINISKCKYNTSIELKYCDVYNDSVTININKCKGQILIGFYANLFFGSIFDTITED